MVTDRNPLTARAIFVSPHLDDVALSCGGIVGRYVEALHPVLVVTCFTAAPDPSLPLTEYAKQFHRECGVGELEADRLWRLRRAEDAAAVNILGAEHLWLQFHDAIYRGTRYCSDDQLFGPVHPGDRELVEQLSAELVALWHRTDRAVVYLPLGVGRHADHQVCFAVAPALRAAGASVWHYEELPYACAHPDAVDRRLAELPPLASQLVDITTQIDRRVRSIAEYTTQLPLLFEPPDAMPTRVREFAGAYAREINCYAERLWSTERGLPGGIT